MKSVADDRIFFSKRMVGDIPVLTCTNESGDPKPLVLLSHGFTGSKEVWREYMQELAEAGYYAVAIDNRLHGEREDEGFSSVMSEGGRINFYRLFRAIKENAEDVVKIIDYFAATEEIDQHRIGMTGVSMGGFTAFRAVVMDKRIKVATPIIASPVWGDIPGDKPADESPEIMRALVDLSRQYSPSHFMDRFHPTALLIQAGSKDTHFRLEKLERFYEDLRHRYHDDRSRLHLIVFDGIAHEFTQSMWINAKSWLTRYL